MTRLILIALLVLILGFLIYLSFQLKKGKSIVLIFGSLKLSDLNAITPSTPSVAIPGAYDISKQSKVAVDWLKNITG